MCAIGSNFCHMCWPRPNERPLHRVPSGTIHNGADKFERHIPTHATAAGAAAANTLHLKAVTTPRERRVEQSSVQWAGCRNGRPSCLAAARLTILVFGF